jgi:predicted DNA-binding transcriptional regulator AlpA
MRRLESIKRRSQCRSVKELLLVRDHHVRESRSGRLPLSGWQQISVTQVSSPALPEIVAMSNELAVLPLTSASDNPAVLITAEAAAQLCEVSLRTWRRLEAEGMVPQPVRLAGRIKRYRRTELLAWMEAGCPSGELWQNIRQVEQRRRAK